MKTWKLLYQNVPFNYTDPAVLLVEAETRFDALVTAYDHLTRRGLAVGFIAACGEEFSRLAALIGPLQGTTHIRTCEQYSVSPDGRVKGGVL